MLVLYPPSGFPGACFIKKPRLRPTKDNRNDVKGVFFNSFLEKLYPRVLNYLKVEKKNKNEEHEISVSIIMHIVRV